MKFKVHETFGVFLFKKIEMLQTQCDKCCNFESCTLLLTTKISQIDRYSILLSLYFSYFIPRLKTFLGSLNLECFKITIEMSIILPKSYCRLILFLYWLPFFVKNYFCLLSLWWQLKKHTQSQLWLTKKQKIVPHFLIPPITHHSHYFFPSPFSFFFSLPCNNPPSPSTWSTRGHCDQIGLVMGCVEGETLCGHMSWPKYLTQAFLKWKQKDKHLSLGFLG